MCRRSGETREFVRGTALPLGDCNMEWPRTSKSSLISMWCELGVGLQGVMKKVPACFDVQQSAKKQKCQRYGAPQQF